MIYKFHETEMFNPSRRQILAGHVTTEHLLMTSHKGRGIPAPALKLHAKTIT